MRDNEKVRAITSENYRDVCQRGEAIRQVLKEAYEAGEAPSLRHLQQRFGVSLKALYRHRRRVLDDLGIADCPRPTVTIPRRRRTPADPTPATETPVAETVETPVETPVEATETPETTETN